MADREYTITLKNSGVGSNKKSPISKTTNKSATETAKDVTASNKGTSTAFGLVAYHKVKSFATQVINHEVSLVGLRTGSNELQGRASFNNSIVQQGVNFAENIAVGAMMGGPWGAVAGAVASVGQAVFSYSLKQDTINTQKAVENVSLQMNIMRAGANGSRGNK